MRTLLLSVALFTLPAVAAAQAPVVNPTTVEFPASSSHAETIPGTSTPAVTNYTLVLTRQADGSVVSETTIGKPAPVAGKIAVNLPVLPNNTLLQIAAKAVGPGGSSVGVPSDPFVAVGPPVAPGKPVVKP